MECRVQFKLVPLRSRAFKLVPLRAPPQSICTRPSPMMVSSSIARFSMSLKYEPASEPSMSLRLGIVYEPIVYEP